MKSPNPKTQKNDIILPPPEFTPGSRLCKEMGIIAERLPKAENQIEGSGCATTAPRGLGKLAQKLAIWRVWGEGGVNKYINLGRRLREHIFPKDQRDDFREHILESRRTEPTLSTLTKQVAQISARLPQKAGVVGAEQVLLLWQNSILSTKDFLFPLWLRSQIS